MPAARTTEHVLLLRAINVGKRQLPMAALRELATALGFAAPRTHLASGNLVAGLAGDAGRQARALEAAIAEHFGFHSDVIVRSGRAWPDYLDDNPFGDAEPSRVMLLLANAAPADGAEAALRERALPSERVQRVRDGLWIHFPDGVHVSKLTPAFIDKCIGAPSTARNWRTVQALAALLRHEPIAPTRRAARARPATPAR